MLFFIRLATGQYSVHRLDTPQDADLYASAMQAGISVDRNDICSWREACEVAANVEGAGPDEYMAVDNGPTEWPRYDVVRAWKIGDRARMVFNGDGFDCGQVCRVSPDYKRIRVTGIKGPRGGRKALTFKRQGKSGVWKRGAFHLER